MAGQLTVIAAQQALELVATRADRYAIHLDVDVVDFTDAPLGAPFSQYRPPHNAAADDGLLERFVPSFADAIG